MSKIDHVKLQDNSEIECVCRFIDKYNSFHNTNFKNLQKNNVQNEIDVICTDNNSGKELYIQIKKADSQLPYELHKSYKSPINEKYIAIRDSNIFVKEIMSTINKAEIKYQKQGKDMSEVILLLDEPFSPPIQIINKIKKLIKSSTFKEIWLTSNINSYNIYK